MLGNSLHRVNKKEFVLPVHCTQSGVLRIAGPEQDIPPFDGEGLMQLRVCFWPTGDRPGQRHSVQALQAPQPPLTVGLY